MSPTDATSLLMQLSSRDIAILESLRSYRLLTTAQIRRRHFARSHASLAAALGATMRVLARLEARGMVARLQRRIGGVRAGSSSVTWQLGATGERLLRTMHGEKRRRRYLEPSPAFSSHTLAVAELAIRLHELHEASRLELLQIQPEPKCWQSFVGAQGSIEWLKPDLHAVTADGDYEDHWFFEADLATEHPPVVVRKAKAYQRYAATGAYQAKHGLFPAVAWVVPDVARQEAVTAALRADKAVQGELFRAVTTADFDHLVAGDSAPALTDHANHLPEHVNEKGGTTHETTKPTHRR